MRGFLLHYKLASRQSSDSARLTSEHPQRYAQASADTVQTLMSHGFQMSVFTRNPSVYLVSWSNRLR